MRANYRPFTAALLSLTILSQSTVGFALAQEPSEAGLVRRLEPRLTPDEAVSHLKTELEKFVTWSSPERDTLIRIESKSDMLLPTRFTYEVELEGLIPFLIVYEGRSIYTAQPFEITREELNKPLREMIVSVSERFEGLAAVLKAEDRIERGRDQYVADSHRVILKQASLGIALVIAGIAFIWAGRKQSQKSAILLGTVAAFISGWAFICISRAISRTAVSNDVRFEQRMIRRAVDEIKAAGFEVAGSEQAGAMAEASEMLWADYEFRHQAYPRSAIEIMEKSSSILMPMILGFLMAVQLNFKSLGTGLSGKQRALATVGVMLPAAFFYIWKALDSGQEKAATLEGLEHPGLVLSDSERQVREVLDRLFHRQQMR